MRYYLISYGIACVSEYKVSGNFGVQPLILIKKWKGSHGGHTEEMGGRIFGCGI